MLTFIMALLFLQDYNVPFVPGGGGGATNNCTTGLGSTFRLFVNGDGCSSPPCTGSYTTHATKEFPASTTPTTVGAASAWVADTVPTDSSPVGSGQYFEIDTSDADTTDYQEWAISTYDLIAQENESMCMMIAGYRESSGWSTTSGYIAAMPAAANSFGTTATNGELLYIRVATSTTNEINWQSRQENDVTPANMPLGDAANRITQGEAFFETYYFAAECGTVPCIGSSSAAASEWNLYGDDWAGSSGSGGFTALASIEGPSTRADIENVEVSGNLRIGDPANTANAVIYLKVLTINVCSGADDTCLCLCDPSYTGCDTGEDDWGTEYFTNGKTTCEASW